MPFFQRRTKFPFEVKIETPCSQSWDEMTGTAAERHCESCQKQVHNFAAMTPRQIERLLAQKNARVCARVVRLTDGSLLTAPSAPTPSYAAGFVLAASLAVGAHAQTAQENSHAKISGFILDKSGAGIAQSKVDILQAGVVLSTVKADELGGYHMDVAAGSYTLRASSPGFVSEDRAVILDRAHPTAIEPMMLSVDNRSVELGSVAITGGSSVIEVAPAIFVGEISPLAARKPWYKRAATATMRTLHLSS